VFSVVEAIFGFLWVGFFVVLGIRMMEGYNPNRQPRVPFEFEDIGASAGCLFVVALVGIVPLLLGGWHLIFP